MEVTPLMERAERQARIAPAGSARPATYSESALADLANQAARSAAASARAGRVVRGTNGRSRLAPMRVSAAETDALAQEAAAEILARIPLRESGLPCPGEIATAFGADPDGSPAERDLRAARHFCLSLLRDDRPQDWRDAAVSIAAARTDAADFDTAAELVADSGDMIGQAELEAADDPMIDTGRGRDPLAPEAQAALYLSGLSAREQGAVRSALSDAPSAVQANAGLAPNAAAWRKRAERGRKDLSAPGRAARVAPALAAVVEAHEGRPALARSAERPESLARQAQAPGIGSTLAARAYRTVRRLDSPDAAWLSRAVRFRFGHDRIRRPRFGRWSVARMIRGESPGGAFTWNAGARPTTRQWAARKAAATRSHRAWMRKAHDLRGD